MRPTDRKPSRILNEPAGFLGLTSLDLCVVGYLLVALHGCLNLIGLGLLAFPVAGFLSFALIAVRLKYRKKIVRDFLLSLVLPKVIYDPET